MPVLVVSLLDLTRTTTCRIRFPALGTRLVHDLLQNRRLAGHDLRRIASVHDDVRERVGEDLIEGTTLSSEAHGEQRLNRVGGVLLAGEGVGFETQPQRYRRREAARDDRVESCRGQDFSL